MSTKLPSVGYNNGPVHIRTNHIPKDVSELGSALSRFESLILAHGCERKAVSNQAIETRFETRK